MYDVIVDGAVIAKAENVEQETIYILDYNGMGNKDIAYLLGIPVKNVTRYTQGGATR